MFRGLGAIDAEGHFTIDYLSPIRPPLLDSTVNNPAIVCKDNTCPTIVTQDPKPLPIVLTMPILIAVGVVLWWANR